MTLSIQRVTRPTGTIRLVLGGTFFDRSTSTTMESAEVRHLYPTARAHFFEGTRTPYNEIIEEITRHEPGAYVWWDEAPVDDPEARALFDAILTAGAKLTLTCAAWTPESAVA